MFWVLALFQSEWQKVNSLTKGLNTQNISFVTLYSCQFMSSTQLMKLNHPFILSHWHSTTVSLENDPHHSFCKVIKLGRCVESDGHWFYLLQKNWVVYLNTIFCHQEGNLNEPNLHIKSSNDGEITRKGICQCFKLNEA